MTAYLNEFTLDWPHGHVVVTRSGSTRPFVVKVTDWPGKFPIWGHLVGDEGSWCFRADGGSDSGYRLRNAAPPKREPREHWMNVYKSGYSLLHKSRSDADKATINGRTECIHFREVIEEDETEDELPEAFDLANAKTALIDPVLTCGAFDWPSTPQGYMFWSNYVDNELSPDDTVFARETLRRWIAIAERRAAK